jgi:hypothetical protein
MHYFSDAQIIGGAILIALHIVGSAIAAVITLRKAFANGRGIAQNHVDIVGVDNRVIAIAEQSRIIRAALGRIEDMATGRPATSRTRSTDPPPMRASTPGIGGITPADTGGAWPIGDP